MEGNETTSQPRKLLTSMLPTDEEKPENFEAYRQWQPTEIDKPATRSQIQDFLKSFGKKFSPRSQK